MSNYRELSKQNWHKATAPEVGTDEVITIGSLQRIADACELMAKDRDRMETTMRWQKERIQRMERENSRLAHSNAAYRGMLKKLKAKP